MKKLNLAKSNLAIAYFGTPYFSARFLEKLITDVSINQLIEINFVVTQPDKPVGKKQIITPSPVKQIAQQYNVPVFDQDITNLGEELRMTDLGLIYFYGQIIPKKILVIPKFGFWNIHFSLLPQYRGPTPATFSLIMGDRETAVSIVQTNEKLDHGDLVSQEKIHILPKETRQELEERLDKIAYHIFKSKINGLLSGKIQIVPQNHPQATYTRFPTKDDGYVPFDVLRQAMSGKGDFIFIPKIVKDYCKRNKLAVPHTSLPITIFNLFRGLSPWPGIWTIIKINGVEKRLKLINVKLSNFKNFQTLQLVSVQLEGKNEVDFKTFQSAYKIFIS